jgi:DNA-binding CsgD family transcriptional regulator
MIAEDQGMMRAPWRCCSPLRTTWRSSPRRKDGPVEELAAALDGSTIADVAARLHLSESTVRDHLSSAIGKTHTRNRIEAAQLARHNGWL